MILKRAALGTILAVLATGPTLAHHSAAMFDAAKEVTLEGTVKEFQFTNPHSWIQLNVADAGGKVAEWSLETGGVSRLYKSGIRASTLKPGDKITVVAHPLKNGNTGGEVRTVTTSDGKVIIGGPQG